MTIYERLGGLFEQATAQAARSTVVGPLIVMTGIFVTATLISFVVGAPLWLNIGLSISTAFFLLLFAAVYLYFMFRDPDALRSEKFSIQKMAIERGLFGDSTTGLLDIEPKPSELRTVSSTTVKRLMTEDEK